VPQIWIVTKTSVRLQPHRGGKWHARMRHSVTRCKWCHCLMTRSGTHVATIDHIQPRCHNGPNTKENVKVSCEWCNSGRAAVDHCYLTLICISSILNSQDLRLIARYYQASLKKDATTKVASASHLPRMANP
jgi:hypothetical protein